MMSCCAKCKQNVRGEERAVMDETGFVEWSYWFFKCVCNFKWYSL